MLRVEVSKRYHDNQGDVTESLFTHDLQGEDFPPLIFGVQNRKGEWNQFTIREGSDTGSIDIYRTDNSITSETPDSQRIGHDYYVLYGNMLEGDTVMVQDTHLDGRDTGIYLNLLPPIAEISSIQDTLQAAAD